MEPVISGIRQVGIGVSDVYRSWEWYRRVLGFDVLISTDTGAADLTARSADGTPQRRGTVLALNLQGGGGLEFWQDVTRLPQPPAFRVLAGDLGIFMLRIKTADIEKATLHLKTRRADFLSGVENMPDSRKAVHISDPYGNLIRIEEHPRVFMKTRVTSGGVVGVSVGVSDMDQSVRFYGALLGYDTVVYDKTGEFADMSTLPGGDGMFRRVLLAHQKSRQGVFSRLLGASTVELVQALDRIPNKIFENRVPGDLGYLQLCFELRGMAALKAICVDMGRPFTVESGADQLDPSSEIGMGRSSGSFFCIEDPDGALIGFAETHRLAIIRRLGLYLNLLGRDPEKPLPNLLLKTLRWHREK
jgi:catechol 2,3-dioxygenase-like lactoylglutathione lyase family enzyme